MRTLLLIDANSILHRCFHALPTLTSSTGEPAQALYGTASILLKILRDDPPAYAAALFDRPEPTFRKEKFAEYKAQRPPTHADLVGQLHVAPELFHAFGIRTFDAPGWEADDLIATLARRFGEADLRVEILTGDRDTLQLVRGDKVVVRTFVKGISETAIHDEAAVREKYGLPPDKLADYKALVGDPSDNIPGVVGVGPKTAADLLRRFGDIAGIFAHPEDPQVKRLWPRREEAFLALDLVRLKNYEDLPGRNIAELAAAFNPDAAAAYLEKMGFKTLRERLLNPKPAVAKRRPAPPMDQPAQGKIF